MSDSYEFTGGDLTKLIVSLGRPGRQASTPIPIVVWDELRLTWTIRWVDPPPPNEPLPITPDRTTTIPAEAIDPRSVSRFVGELTADSGRVIELFVAGAEFRRLASYDEVAAKPEQAAELLSAADQLFKTGISRLAGYA
jgi:hypothetical protein